VYIFSQVQYNLPDDDRRPKYVGAIFVFQCKILNFSNFNKTVHLFVFELYILSGRLYHLNELYSDFERT
jgi:hypothetical protein